MTEFCSNVDSKVLEDEQSDVIGVFKKDIIVGQWFKIILHYDIKLRSNTNTLDNALINNTERRPFTLQT